MNAQALCAGLLFLGLSVSAQQPPQRPDPSPVTSHSNQRGETTGIQEDQSNGATSLSGPRWAPPRDASEVGPAAPRIEDEKSVQAPSPGPRSRQRIAERDAARKKRRARDKAVIDRDFNRRLDR